MIQEKIKNPNRRKNLQKLGLYSLLIIAVTWVGVIRIGFNPRRVDGTWENFLFIISKFFPEDYFEDSGAINWALDVAVDSFIETIQIGLLGSIVACIIAYPICLMSSKLTAPNKIIYGSMRTVLNVLRTLPELFWVIIATTALGFGSFAGLISVIIFITFIIYKLFAETLDALDPGPLEAVRATGATYFTSLIHSVVKEVNPVYFALCIYMIELSIRISAVIGLVGAGGIGQLINVERVYFHWDNVSAIVLAMTLLIVALEILSTNIRTRILR